MIVGVFIDNVRVSNNLSFRKNKDAIFQISRCPNCHVSFHAGDIGGQLGLFLGASFITLAEILSYFARKIENICRINRCSKQSVIGPKHDRENNEFPLKVES